MASPIWGGAYSSLFLGHSAWLIHSFAMVGEICPVRQDGKQGERNLRRPCSYPTCAIRSGKLFLRKRSRFLELIGSLVVMIYGEPSEIASLTILAVPQLNLASRLASGIEHGNPLDKAHL